MYWHCVLAFPYLITKISFGWTDSFSRPNMTEVMNESVTHHCPPPVLLTHYNQISSVISQCHSVLLFYFGRPLQTHSVLHSLAGDMN